MPKIVGATLEEHRLEVRERLFGALRRLLAVKGFDAITLSEIAATAGIGRTAVYNFFSDKESILIGLITAETSRYLQRLQADLADVDSPVEQLRLFIRHQADLDPTFHLSPGPDLRTILSPETLRDLREHGIAVDRLLRQIILTGVAREDFANLPLEKTLPYVNACIWAPIPHDPGPERDAALRSKEMFILRGLGACKTVLDASGHSPQRHV